MRMQYNAVRTSEVRSRSALYCVELHCIAVHCIALHCTALHCIELQRAHGPQWAPMGPNGPQWAPMGPNGPGQGKINNQNWGVSKNKIKIVKINIFN